MHASISFPSQRGLAGWRHLRKLRRSLEFLSGSHPMHPFRQFHRSLRCHSIQRDRFIVRRKPVLETPTAEVTALVWTRKGYAVIVSWCVSRTCGVGVAKVIDGPLNEPREGVYEHWFVICASKGLLSIDTKQMLLLASAEMRALCGRIAFSTISKTDHVSRELATVRHATVPARHAVSCRRECTTSSPHTGDEFPYHTRRSRNATAPFGTVI